MLSAFWGQGLAGKVVQKIIINTVSSGALSLLHRDALNKAMKKTIKELFDLLEYELGIDEDTDTEELIPIRRAVDAFLDQETVQEAIVSLLKEPQYLLDPATFIQGWQEVQDAPPLPEDFSWQRISKSFSRKTKGIRNSTPELKTIFAQEMAIRADEAVADSVGPQPDFDLETYAEALLKKFGRPGSLGLSSMDIDGAAYDAVRLWQVFVPQSVRESRNLHPRELELPKGEKERQEKLRPYFDQLPRPVLKVCADEQLQRLVILGDPGSGKSSLLRFLALEWARDNDPNRRALAPVPLLIELREYHSKRRQGECNDNFLSYLHKAYSLHRFNQNDLDNLLKKTPDRFLLLLDGLDEIFDRQEREQVVSDIHRFSNQYKKVRIIITSRVVGYEAHRLRDAEFSDFMLQDFAPEQIDEFLNRWHEVIFAENQTEEQGKRERLAKAIKDSQPIAQLAGNPLMLTMMAIINRNRALPRKRVKLYEQATELFLQQWDTEGKLLNEFPGLSEEIDFDVKVAILRKVAVAMQTVKGQAANIIQKEELRKLIEEYLREELYFDQARAAANALINQLRDRNFILCFVGDDSYAFVHRTFLEYFCATEFVDRFQRKQTLSLEGLLNLYDAHCRDDDWQEVLRLICGQVDEQFAGRIIAHLTDQVDLKAWDTMMSTPIELTLAVWCLGEVKNLKRIEEKTGTKLLVKVMDRCLLDEEFEVCFDDDDLLVATKAVGIGWPGKAVFHFTGQYPKDFRLFSQWPDFLHAVFQQRQWIEQLCGAENSEVRTASYITLTENWPDRNTHQLLRKWVVQDDDVFSRSTVLKLLAAYWPDDETFQLLRQCAVQDEHEDTRSSALKLLLAAYWPDDEIFQFVKQCAVQDEHEDTRSTALKLLAEHWAADETRQLFVQRAVDDEHEKNRYIALEHLVKHWADDKTRQLFMQQVVHDEHENIRYTTLEQLIKHWADDKTRQLLTQQVIWDKRGKVSDAALEHLVKHWPDSDTRYLLYERVFQGNYVSDRRNALELLTEYWIDEETRQLLVEQLVYDEDKGIRHTALKQLAKHWPDDEVRNLLIKDVIYDEDQYVRSTALEELVKHWSNDETRQFLIEQAIQNEYEGVRRSALYFLVREWPDDETRQLLTERVVRDEHKNIRCVALEHLAEHWLDDETRQLLKKNAPEEGVAAFLHGKIFSCFGEIMFWKHPVLKRRYGYLDPRQPIPSKHIQKAAEKAGIPPDKIDETVRSLSEHMGWDITKGSGAVPNEPTLRA